MGTYLNVDDSRSRPSGVIKNCEKNVFTFLDVSDQKEHILFFPKNNILLSTGPGCFALGPGPREYRTCVPCSVPETNVHFFWQMVAL